MGPFGTGCFLTALAASFAITTPAQILTPSSGNEELIRKVFDRDANTSTPHCSVTSARPAMNYSLRFQAGFTFDVPKPAGPDHRGQMLIRVLPEHDVPTYFVSRIKFSDAAEKMKNPGRLHAGFVVAEGKYRVDAVYLEDDRQVCRSHWTMEAKLDGAARRLRVAAPAASVGAGGNQSRVTVLLHLTPPSLSSAKLPASEVHKLLGSLCALLDNLNGTPVRLVVFDLENQKVLLRKDGFTDKDLLTVAKLATTAQYGVVDYATLRNPQSSIDLLTQLMDEETARLNGSDSLVILGAHAQMQGSISSDVISEAAKKLPAGARIFYMECEPLPQLTDRPTAAVPGWTAANSTLPEASGYVDGESIDRIPRPSNIDDGSSGRTVMEPASFNFAASSMDPDIIEHLVGKMKGTVMQIRTPDDCARAIDRIASRENEIRETASRENPIRRP